MTRTQTLAKPVSTFTPAPTGSLQRKCACGAKASGEAKCSKCEADVASKRPLQRKVARAEGIEEAPPIVNEILRSSGQPLGSDLNSFLLPRFGHDFSRVRVNSEAKSEVSAKDVNAREYTVGQEVGIEAIESAPRNTSSKGGALLQRKCACGGTPGPSGECAECEKKNKKLQRKANHSIAPSASLSPSRVPFIQRKLTIGASNDPLEQEADRIADQVLAAPANLAVSGAAPHIQRFSGQSTGQAETAPASVDNVLASPGAPLDPALQKDMSQRFGHDFSRVRVHSGMTAQQSARDVSAHAYTVGLNIVFASGQFSPGTHEGRKLLAHELTHVVQQTGTTFPITLQRAPADFKGATGRRSGSTLPYREAKNLADCIRIMGDKNAEYCRQEVLGEDVSKASPSSPSPGAPSLSAGGSGKTARIVGMERLRNCAYTITYANPRQVNCDTAWKMEKGTNPPGPLCGAALVYDIVSVSATGSKCPPKLDGLVLQETVKGDQGCTPPNHKWTQGKCTIGAGGTISGCTDTFSLCGLTSALQGSCIEIVDQEIEIGGQLAEEHEIIFDLKKSATICTGTVTRN